jgi:signal transduction histidine kinase/CHASE3 domain sensor protein
MRDSSRGAPADPSTPQADQQHFRQVLTRAIIVPVLAMLALAAVFLALIGLLLDTARRVEQADQVIAQLRFAEKLLVDRETGLRGYLLTGNRSFLEPYAAADALLPAQLDALGALLADRPAQLERLETVAGERRAWEAFAQEALARYEAGGNYQAYVSAGIGKGHMDAMRRVLDEMVATEETLRMTRVANTERTSLLVTGASLLLAAGLGVALAWVTRAQLLALAEQYGAALAAAKRGMARLRALHQIDRAILARQPLGELVGAALQRLAPLLGSARSVAVLDLPNLPDPLLLIVEPDGIRTDTVARPEAAPPLVSGGHDGTTAVWETERLGSASPVARPLLEAQLPIALVVPLRSNGVPDGLLAIGLPATARVDADVTALLDEVADQLTIALQQERLRRDIERHSAELEQRVDERTAALAAANAELEAFGYSVAHDLRAPVRAMQSFAAAIVEDYADQLEPLGQEYAQRIVAAGERMEQLIDDLLTYSRLSRAELSFGVVAVRQVLDDALAQLAETIAASGASIRIEEPLPVVVAHRTTLVQVLANLLANAITFVAPGVTPAITVRSTVSGRVVRIEMQDNGVGIAPEHQERIFRVFERLHGVEQYPGTGIGLAIVRKGVERMRGRAGVESRLGAGSTFWIELPMAEDDS